MYLCQARWYDPVTARWVTRDPIGYAGGANLYGYCGGGPVGWADPSGLRTITPGEAKLLVVKRGAQRALAPFGKYGKAISVGIEAGWWLSDLFPHHTSDQDIADEIGRMRSVAEADPCAEGTERRLPGPILFRVVEQPEHQSLLASGGRVTPSPSNWDEKYFFVTLEAARTYRDMLPPHWHGGMTWIWAWGNPSRVGYPFPHDNLPGWNVPNRDLPRLTPGIVVEGP